MIALYEETSAPPLVSESEALEQHIRLTDAENECAHGHLPHDANPSCECWTLARTAGLLGQAPLTERDALDVMAGSEVLPMKLDQEVTVAPATEQSARERAEEMYAHYENGDTLAEVGKRYGVTGKTVGDTFRSFDMAVRPRGSRPGSQTHSTPVAPVEPAPAAVVEPKVETEVAGYENTARQLLVELEAQLDELHAEVERLSIVRDGVRELIG